MTSRFIRRPVAVVVAAGVFAAGIAGVALASTKHGITPVSPKQGATVPVGKSPTFKMRVHGAGQVWVYVCKSPKKHKEGVICHGASIGQAHKHGGVFTYKPEFFDYPAFWLNTPGTYYWQAHRIKCETTIKDCLQEGPITRFKVG
jgi:hypothetical protein